MIPVHEILKKQKLTPRPPVLVIDETVLKCSNDIGPVCGCDEKYDAVKKYKPFFPGAVNPYKRREIPGSDLLHIYWKILKTGEEELHLEKPIAIHSSEIQENFKLPKEPQPTDEMFLRQHKYTDGYIIEKLRQCQRQHTENCTCPNK